MLLDQIMFLANLKTSMFVYIYFAAQKDNVIRGIQSDTSLAVCLKPTFYIVYFKHTKQLWYQ